MNGAFTARNAALAMLLCAAALRLFVFSLSIPNNAYDDHMEAIAQYASHRERPAADACWQCYQPPAYYALASLVLRATSAASGDNVLAWRAVQLLSVLFSLGALALVWRILTLAGSGSPGPRLCALAVAVLLPREVYTSVFISNDEMLTFAVTLCVWLYLEALARCAGAPGRRTEAWLVALLAAAAMAGFTKQHGLIAAALPVALAAWPPTPEAAAPNARRRRLAVLALGLLLVASEPLYQFLSTGHLLVSNQHYFDWPRVQRPGSIAAASFFDFRFLTLLREPTLSSATIDSFWTQLFAKLWFDYDPKFLVDSPASRRLAAAWYLGGLLFTAIWALGLVTALRRWRAPHQRVLLLVQGAFLAVPLLQSLRMPYYSSMKATFFLPALSVSALLLCCGFERLWGRPLLRGLLVGACAGLALLFAWECALMREQIRDALLASLRGGKLWGFPPGWGTR